MGKKALEMKKIALSVCCGLLILCLGITCIYLNHPGKQTYDLSNFSGIIIHEKVALQKPLTSEIPFSQALYWGKNAILIHGLSGIVIRKPNDLKPGEYLFAQESRKKIFYMYDVIIKNHTLSIEAHTSLILIIALIGISLSSTLVTLIITRAGKPKYKNLQGDNHV